MEEKKKANIITEPQMWRKGGREKFWSKSQGGGGEKNRKIENSQVKEIERKGIKVAPDPGGEDLLKT